jgi:pre-mRNA-splicing factor 18
MQQQADAEVEEEEVVPNLPVKEVKRRLRQMRQVVTFFGESEGQRFKRLRLAETQESTSHDADFSLGHGYHGHSNPFLDEKALQKMDASKAGKDTADMVEKTADSDSDDDEMNAESPRAGGGEAGEKGEDGEPKKLAFGQKPVVVVVSDYKKVYRYFRGILKGWEEDLQNREDHLKRGAQAKIATKTQKQCKDYIRPLFKMCKTKGEGLNVHILKALVKIVNFCEEGEFSRVRAR